MDTAKPFSTITAEGNLGEAVLAAEELFAAVNTNIEDCAFLIIILPGEQMFAIIKKVINWKMQLSRNSLRLAYNIIEGEIIYDKTASRRHYPR